VSKHGAKFDLNKAHWFNHQYMIRQDEDLLTNQFIQILKKRTLTEIVDRVRVKKIVNLMKNRVNFIAELWDQSYFFFVPPTEYDEKAKAKYWKDDTKNQLLPLCEKLKDVENFNSDYLNEFLNNYITENNLKTGDVMNTLRLALVGKPIGPHINDIMDLLGKQETINRIIVAIEKI